jgi:tetratricopeptide (TPR) repeat protein
MAYRKATELDPSTAANWILLADLLHFRLGRFSEAEEAYRKALEIDVDEKWGWNNLGLLLGDCLGRHEEASHALQKAIELDPEDSLAPAYNLVSVLRDQLGRIRDAQRIFSKLVPPEDEALQAGLLLHPTLFATYLENWGVATEHLGKALDLIADQSAFPPSTFPGWMRATAVLLHLGYGDKLLEFLRVRGDDQRLRPWYEAIRAHFRGDRRYLRNIPAEMRDVAGMLYDEINTRLRILPDSTRRWSPPTGVKRVASRRRSR